MSFSVFSKTFNLISILVCLANYVHCGCKVEDTNNSINCNGFQSWSDLNKMINNSINSSKTTINNAIIQPSSPILLTSELDISSLLNTLKISTSSSFILIIQSVSGIEVVEWPSGIPRISIEIDQSQIEFYLNGKPLSDYTCSPNMMAPFLKNNRSINNASFFNAFSEISFFTKNQYSTQPICPYIFADSKLDQLAINEQTGSNNWKFKSLDINQPTTTINSFVRILKLQGNGYALGKSLLNPLVFELLESLTIYNSISLIQSDIFKNYEQLYDLTFQLDDLESFFHQVGIAWTMSLNTNFPSIEVSFNDMSALDKYMYPDEDFCIFANFPTQTNIFPILNSGNLTNCTSTIRWLLSYYFSHNMTNVFDEYGDTKSLYSECESAWNQTLTNDPKYFNKKNASQCNLTTTTTSTIPSTTSLTVSNATHECSLKKFCTREGWCENFTSLIELNSMVSSISSSCNNFFFLNSTINNNTVAIKANKYQGPLNDRFNYELFVELAFPKIFNYGINIAFYGFKGLDFNLSSVYKSHSLINPEHLGFYFQFDEFNFYSNGKKVKDSSSCDESELVKTSNYGIFSAIFSLTFNFNYKSPDSRFAKWCPMIFKNTKLYQLSTAGKPLRFKKGKIDQSNMIIQLLTFQELEVEYLNEEILNFQTFSKLNYFSIRGSVKKIQMDVFKELKEMKNIDLDIYNFKGFIHGNGIEWMNNINYYATPANSSLLEIKCDQKCLKTLRSFMVSVQINNLLTDTNIFPVHFFPYAQPYLFPDEDFCIFANYPHERAVLTFIEYDLSNCTCTITWLYKNLVLLANQSIVNNGFAFRIGNACMLLINDSAQYDRAFKACNFPDKINKCNLSTANLNQSFVDYKDMYFYFYGIQSNLKQTQQILNTYFDTWVLFLGLLANLIIAIVIINSRYKADRYKNKKDNPLGGIDELFFTYMLINALIDLVYCLMMFFYKIFPCEPSPNGEMHQINNCLITNIIILTTESILKLLANVTYLQMSLNRYLLIGKDHAEWLKTIAKAYMFLVLLISFICSILLSYVIVDQQNFINFLFTGLEPNDYFYYHSYSSLPINLHSQYPFTIVAQYFTDNLTRIIALTIVHDLFSYFLFCILNLIADVITVLKLKETLAEKARIGVSTKEKKQEQERAERRSILMVVLNSLTNVLFRIPELLSIIFFFILTGKDNKYIYRLMCFNFGQCNAMNQISDSFYFFTTVFNIFFYYFFNKTFKLAFHLTFLRCNLKSQ